MYTEDDFLKEDEQLVQKYLESEEDIRIDDFVKKYATDDYKRMLKKERKLKKELGKKGIYYY